MTVYDDQEAIEKEVRKKPAIQTPMLKKTWNVDWEYPLARGIQKLINLFKKGESK